MLTVVVDILRSHPEIALFLTLALGYLIGKVRLGGHALGLVTGALFAGLLMGQLAIEVSNELKIIFLLLFLFANGYGAGPQFFRALRQDGFGPLVLTLVVCFSGLLMVWLTSRLMGLSTGYTAGLLSGALTQSSAMGTASEAIMALPLPEQERLALVNQIPIADAVCYLFGFWGEVIFVAAVLPKLLGIDLEKEAKALDAKLGIKEETSVRSAYSVQAARGVLIETDRFRTVADLEAEAAAAGQRLTVLRVRHGDHIIDATPSTALKIGDVVALAGRRSWIVDFTSKIGREEDDAVLLDIPFDSANIIITNAAIEKETLGEIAATRDYTRGIFITRLRRGEQDIPISLKTRLQQGDGISLVGNSASLAKAADDLGYWERPSILTNMFTLGVGIVVGCLIGLPALYIGGVKLALSTSVGTLLAGLFLGWLHSKRPWMVGNIPEPTRLFLINFGLAGFVAITGLHAGPGFIAGLKDVGIPLFIAGIFCTCVPPTIGMLFGKYILRMNPVLLLGAVSGAQTMTAAMVAVQERAKSQAPVIGFTVPYALGNIILTTFGSIIVLLVS
ncbi:aspartate-alanine antiporter [Rhizobium sp. KVB221]|uniref:Aspartate-alanine antiporter n=1 Tax=Rhizobium setariae TaxID=2801340 RepID=A0A936YRM9_9HYPH|nr:aspartate-alanine antiporter [Rhizobium setariae]MBL0372949.1 aspartate-alanine antiporter [Rhizobium setariae]